MMMTKQYAEVAVNRPIRQSFHYHIPVALAGRLKVGHLVEVSFGTSTVSGIIVGFADNTPIPETKPIRKILDPQPVITPTQLELAYWLADTSLSAIGQCLWLMLPPGLTSDSMPLYTLIDPDDEGNTKTQKRVLNLLRRRGALTNHQLQRSLSRMDWQSAVNQLMKRGAVERQQVIQPPKARPKMVRTARLAIPSTIIPSISTNLGRESRRANVLEVLLAAPDNVLSFDDVMEFAGCAESPVVALEKLGYIEISSDKHVQLCLTSDEVYERIIEMRGGQRYIDILNILAAAQDDVDVGEIYAQTNSNLKHLNRLADDGLIVLGETEVWRDPLADQEIMGELAPPLTHDQQAVWDVVKEYIDGVHWGGATPNPASSHVFMLHGVTGSGKTEIYMRAVERVVAQGRQAIVLVPEIALTTQLVQRFSARFPNQVSVIHSRLTAGERYDTWRRVRSGEIQIMVGARSALFAPLPDLGLVILDEEHDDSYKQSPPIQPPYYHAREVAIAAMQQNRGTVILGSATPDLTTMYRAEQDEFVLLQLPDRVLARRDKIQQQTYLLNLPSARYVPTDADEPVSVDLPPVEIVDMREELKAGNRSVFSYSLQEKLETVLAANVQALLFLNRRGTATFVMCRDCGAISKCPRCDTPLTYHAPREALVCHYCGHRQANPQECPECGSRRIKHFGSGTEQIHRALEELLPTARVLRWDYDTASERGAHERILKQFMERDADILVGTQMIAKGLDIPLVTLVGIISADTALGLPDFRVGERTFQLLTQVAGRAGRGLLGGEVVLQTYQPEHYAIQAAAQHDYFGFYQQEIRYRRETRYPPFARITRILFRHHHEAEAKREAEVTAEMLRKRVYDGGFTTTEIVGPTPCFFTRLNTIFRWQIVVRSADPVLFFRNVELSGNAMLDIDPVDLL